LVIIIIIIIIIIHEFHRDASLETKLQGRQDNGNQTVKQLVKVTVTM